MRSGIRLAIFVTSTVAIAACSVPTSPSPLACRSSAKIPGVSACANKDYINPDADYINPDARHDTSDTTQH